MIFDILFPKFCFGCGWWGKYICKRCVQTMEYIEKDACVNCKRVSYLGIIHNHCKRADDIDGCLSIFYYNKIAKKIITNLKYRLVTDACEELFVLCNVGGMQKFMEFERLHPDAVFQPIPLHSARQARRGFNQADLITTFFQQHLSYHTIDALKRVKNTKPLAQTHHRLTRYYNIQNAFKIFDKEKVKGKTIILVDDVVTSGSTTREAAKTLKKAGAERVFVFSLAHG